MEIFFFYVKELDLSRNRLNGFDVELAEKLLKIENVRFEKNQIICDVCNVGAMLDRKHLVCAFSLFMINYFFTLSPILSLMTPTHVNR